MPGDRSNPGPREGRGPDAGLYEARYAGEYMGAGDSFTRWGREGLERGRVAAMLRPVPAEEVGAILDYGCGRGAWVDLLEECFPDAHIRGVEVAERAVAAARAEHPRHRFVAFDGRRAPFQDGLFDLVFSYHVLEHVEDAEAVAADIARLLRRGGRFCLSFPCGNAGSMEERLTRLVRDGRPAAPDGSRLYFFEDESHVRRLTTDEAVALFARHGLEIEERSWANHRWGAWERITKSGVRAVRRLLPVTRANAPGALARLVALRAVWEPATLLVQLAELDPRKPRGTAKRAAIALLWPARMIGRLVRALLEAAARREWRRRRDDPAGSAHYLRFRKP